MLWCAVLQRNPVLRPSAAEALEHPWLAVEGEANEMPLKVCGLVLCHAAPGRQLAVITAVRPGVHPLSGPAESAHPG